MKPNVWVSIAASTAFLWCGGCGDSGDKAEAPESVALDPVAIFGPALPDRFESAENPTTPAKVDLGRMLYYDTRLSLANDVSCNTCHLLDQYGVDSLPTSKGHEEQVGGRNAPTVYNAAGHLAQFWDGRAKDVEEQAKGPILNPIEMGMPSEEHVLGVLKGIDGYVKAFAEVFPGEADPVTYDNMARAIGCFERGLVTPSGFDRFLAGDKKALTEAEHGGLETFMKVGCATCHIGPLVGGKMYQKVGLVNPWPNQEDVGRSAITGNEAEKMFFKVPSLLNIARTGPYFHDGSVSHLDEAVRMMGHHQLGLDLTAEQEGQILAFLNALTGSLPDEYIRKPELP
ncbi:MAG: cytochrome c peroxidase [Planctomycetota bacterium]